MVKPYVKAATIDGKSVSVRDDGMIRVGRTAGKPYDQHPIWETLTKGQKRAIRRAAFRNGYRNFAHESVG